MIKILLGGSPCTYWSISQKSEKREVTCEGIGWELFKNYVIAKEKFKPDFFLYENNESISKNIQEEIEKELGVKLYHFNSALVSAQTRHRIYATNSDTLQPPADTQQKVKDIIDWNYAGENLIDLVKFNNVDDTVNNNRLVRLGTIGKGGQGERVYSINGKSCTLSANGGGRGAKTGLYLINGTVRKLNPVEAERLQTLPDNYTEGLSAVQRYKSIGNGWTAEMIIHIMKSWNIPLDEELVVLSLYDGIATGRYCLDKLGYKNIKYFAYEIDKHPISCALKNYPDIIELGDAFAVRSDGWNLEEGVKWAV